MPTISSFFGILIRMYYRDHAPPHFHALYGDQEALIEIETLEVIDGKLSSRALGLVRDWAKLHREELRTNWRRARTHDVLTNIEPLE